MDYKGFLGSKVGWVPALRWIPAYSTRRFGLDLVAGLSLAAFVIPESLAYASLAQLPPVTGLYCYLVAGIAYAVFGTSRQLAVGPTSALAITVATSVVAMADGDLSRAVTLASAVALIVGVICIAGRFVGLANVAYFISDAIWLASKRELLSTSHRHNYPSCSALKVSPATCLSALAMSCCRSTRPTFFRLLSASRQSLSSWRSDAFFQVARRRYLSSSWPLQ